MLIIGVWWYELQISSVIHLILYPDQKIFYTSTAINDKYHVWVQNLWEVRAPYVGHPPMNSYWEEKSEKCLKNASYLYIFQKKKENFTSFEWRVAWALYGTKMPGGMETPILKWTMFNLRKVKRKLNSFLGQLFMLPLSFSLGICLWVLKSKGRDEVRR